MAHLKSHSMFFQSARNGEQSPQTGGDVVDINFEGNKNVPMFSVMVVRDTKPLTWRVHETETHYADVGTHKKQGDLLGAILDRYAAEPPARKPSRYSTHAPGDGSRPDAARYRPTPKAEVVEYAYTGFDDLLAYARKLGYTGKATEQDESPIDDFLGQMGITIVEDAEAEAEAEPKADPIPTLIDIMALPDDEDEDEADELETLPEFEECEELTEAEPLTIADQLATDLAEAEGEAKELRILADELTAERDELQDRHNELIAELRTARAARDAAIEDTKAAKAEHTAYAQQVVEMVERRRQASATKAAKRKARLVEADIATTLLFTLTEAVMAKAEAGATETPQADWAEAYQRLTQETTQHPARLTQQTRDAGHRLYRANIKPL